MKASYLEDHPSVEGRLALALAAAWAERDGERVVWREGVDGEAAESYDRVAETIYSRLR